MDDMWTLFLLSLAMLIGCYLSGIIPLIINLSEEKLRLVTVLGAGLLVGTALAVIIPEGVHTLYETKKAHEHGEHSHKKREASVGTVASEHAHGHEHEQGHTHSDLHTLIGIALVLGFIFMLLVDQIGGGAMHSHGAVDAETGPTIQNRKKITATLGLVVHAAADGVALGAAATTSQTHVEMIVFIAIMLHKAPAAFGLVSFLLHEGFDRNRIRRHLLIFSVAAPAMAILTYFGLSRQSKETLADVNATGIAMLFSAGTFLYVSTVHILPEIQNMGQTTNVNGTVIVREHQGLTKTELFLLVTGSLLPVILSLGHHH